MMNRPNDPRMSPEDQRNMFLFLVFSAIIFFSYEILVFRPHMEAEKAKRQAELIQMAEQDGMAIDIATGSISHESFAPREEVLHNTPDRIKLDNGLIYGSIDLEGGTIDDVSLHNHYETIDDKVNISVLNPKGTEHARFAQFGWLPVNDQIKVPASDSKWKVKSIAEDNTLSPEHPVVLTWNNGQGITFERTLTIDDGFVISIEDKIINNSKSAYSFYPFALVSQRGIPEGYRKIWTMHEGPIGYIHDELKEITYKALNEDKQIEKDGIHGWIGFAEKYWFVSIVPEQDDVKRFRFIQNTKGRDPISQSTYQTDIRGQAVTVAAGEDKTYVNHLFAGTKKLSMLDRYEEELGAKHFDLAIDFGMWYFMTKPLLYLLTFLYGIAGNFGVAIIMLTVMIRGSVFPLTNASYRSFAKMKKVSPQMKELQAKYAGDSKKLQEELLKLYDKENVNPMAGCLPIIIQIPIFFALYKVISINIDMRHAPFFGWIQDLTSKDPTSVFNLFGLLPYDVPEVLVIGVWPCLLLCALIMQRSMSPPPQDEMQKMMIHYMPWFMTFMMSKFASGLVIYWTFSAMLSTIQQYIIMRSMGVEVKFFRWARKPEKKDDEDKEKDEKESSSDAETEAEADADAEAKEEASDKETDKESEKETKSEAAEKSKKETSKPKKAATKKKSGKKKKSDK